MAQTDDPNTWPNVGPSWNCMILLFLWYPLNVRPQHTGMEIEYRSVFDCGGVLK